MDLVKSNKTDDAVDKAAWSDSDDEKVRISLASRARNRKLRVNEDEDTVSGKAYQSRLRL